MRVLITLLIAFASPGISAEMATCTYTSYKWSTVLRQAIEHVQVSKDYSDITDSEFEEISGCTICQEDQVELTIANVKPFKVCRNIAADIQYTLEEAIFQGVVIDEVQGYRVGKTRGEVDHDGNRTQFSNHSFGTSVDINPQFNGLYDNCIKFSSTCRLIRGGEWNPKHQKSLSAEGQLVHLMDSIGLQWGGVIKGKQKDFMHFSYSGY